MEICNEYKHTNFRVRMCVTQNARASFFLNPARKFKPFCIAFRKSNKTLWKLKELKTTIFIAYRWNFRHNISRLSYSFEFNLGTCPSAKILVKQQIKGEEI